MWIPLLRKAKADLAGRPLQTALIFVVVALATGVLATSLTTQVTVDRAFETRFNESDGAHVWFYYLPQQTEEAATFALDPAVLERIGEREEVTGTSGLIPYVRRMPAILDDGTSVDLRLHGIESALPEVGHPIITKGRWLKPEHDSEIVLDHGLAQTRGLEIGDHVQVVGRDGAQTFDIVGLTVLPALSYPHTYSDSLPYATAYVLPQALDVLEPDRRLWSWEYGVRIADPDQVWEFSRDVRESYPEGQMPFYLTWDTTRGWVDESVRIYLLLIGLIGIFAVGVASFVIANTVAGNVLAQVRDVGILKAMGFTPRQAALVLLVEHAGVGLVGAIAGALAGFGAAPLVVAATGNVLGAPPPLVFDGLVLTAVVLGVTLIIAIAVTIPARRAGKVSTVAALTVGVAGPRSAGSSVVKLMGYLRLPLVVVVGLKDVFNRPIRSALTVAALVVATIMATFSLGMETTIREILHDPRLFGADAYEIGITNRDASAPMPLGEVVALLEGRPGVDSYVAGRVMRAAIADAATDGESPDLIRVAAYGPGYERLSPYIQEGHLFANSGEAVITQRLAREQGIEIGQGFALRVDGEQVAMGESGDTALTFTASGIYIADNLQVMTSLDAIDRQLGFDLPPTQYLVKVAEGTDADALRVALLREADDRLMITVSDPVENIEEAAGYIRPPLFALSMILFVTSVISVLITLLFVVRERYREFAILKTMGFTPRQIGGSIVSGASVLAVAGLVIGIPLGLGFTRLAMNLIGTAAQINTFGSLPGTLEVALLVPVMLLVAILGAIVPASRAARITVVEALRFQ